MGNDRNNSCATIHDLYAVDTRKRMKECASVCANARLANFSEMIIYDISVGVQCSIFHFLSKRSLRMRFVCLLQIGLCGEISLTQFVSNGEYPIKQNVCPLGPSCWSMISVQLRADDREILYVNHNCVK